MSYHRKTTPQFVEEAQRVHGEKFDYSEVEYINTHTPVKIKCRQCGVVFMQEPASHLAGCGCPKCSKKKTDRKMTQGLQKQESTRYFGSREVLWLFCNLVESLVKISKGHHSCTPRPSKK